MHLMNISVFSEFSPCIK